MTSKPLRQFLTLQSILAIILPFAAVLLFGIFWALPRITSDTEKHLTQLAQAVGMQVGSHLETATAIVKATAAMPRGDQKHLDSLLASTNSMSSLYEITPDGKVSLIALRKEHQSQYSDQIGLNLSRNPLFRDVQQMKKPHWSKTFLSVISGGLVVAYGAPGVGATVIGEVDLAHLTSFLMQISPEKDLLILIVDHNGQIVADNKGRYTAQQLNIKNIPLVENGIRTDNPTTGRFGFSGEAMTGSIIQITDIDWHVVVATPSSSLYRTSLYIAQLVLAGILIAVCCSVMASIYLARKLSGRFDELTRHAQNIANGDIYGEWPTSLIAEFNLLSTALQHMAASLHQQDIDLRESEERYRLLVNNIPLGVSLIDRDYRIVMTNRTQAEMFGNIPEYFTGRHCYEEFEKRDATCKHCPGSASMISNEESSVETEGVRADGSRFSAYVRTVPLRGANGESTGFIEVVEDITERKHAEEKIRLSEEGFKALAEASFGGIIIHDKGLILECNKGLSDITGFSYEEHIGMNGLELIAPESLDTVLANIRSQYDKGYEVIGVRKDGSKYPLAIRGKNLTYKGNEARVIEFRDVTDHKRAEEERLSLEKQLLHAQKLESLGVLAGGIAHDFNNILMAIIGNADLALMRISKESPAVENLHRIEQSAARAADLAKQMLAYSGKGKFVVENLDLNVLLEEMLHMLEVSISKKAVMRLNQHQHLPSIEADATQMRQIIMNLVINASEAIGDRSGVIAITTGCMDCDRSYLKDVWLDENLTDGLYVYLEIADTGCGMDRETLAKLFDPFFTTKFTGRGLGMAAVLGIIRGHKGAIKVYSEQNKGTTFKILLPASGKPADLFNGNGHANGEQGSGTVLLVDDEETIRGIGTEMLKELGYTAITASDGREAIEIYRSRTDITLVILDLTMPHVDGEQCFRELKQLNPAVKVIMSSGFNEHEVTQKFIGKGLTGFIQKPYRLSTLKNAIQEALTP